MGVKEFTYVLKCDYIVEDKVLVDNILEHIENNNFILLVAPQGTGKTEFINKKLKDKYIYISPTRALSNQINKDYNLVAVYGLSEYTEEVHGGDRYGVDISKEITSTMASVEHVVDIYSQDYDYLVVDEIHKLVQYSSFAYIQVERTLRAIKYFLEKGKKVIITTATPNLLYCLGNDFMNKIDYKLVVKSDKKYVRRVEVFNDFKLLDLIKRNYKPNQLQIVLNNNKVDNESIINKLPAHIRKLHINSDNYENYTDVLRGIAEATNTEYDILLVTSWADCGLNFKGTNITFIYCVFDNFYQYGDFTVIQQFMARARNCKPILFIREPELSDGEKILTKNNLTGVENDKEQSDILYLLLEPVAKRGLEEFKRGIITEKSLKNFRGIYKTQNTEYTNRYEFSSITLRYQIDKLINKYKYNQDKSNHLKNIFNTNDVTIFNDPSIINVCNNLEKKRIIYYIKELFDKEIEFLPDDFRDKIRELSNYKYGYNSNGRKKNFPIKKFVRDISVDFLDNILTIKFRQVNHGGVRYYKIIADSTITNL